MCVHARELMLRRGKRRGTRYSREAKRHPLEPAPATLSLVSQLFRLCGSDEIM